MSGTSTISNSYFGYSVIMYKGDRSFPRPWIQISAPKGNDTNNSFFESGAVYRCSIYGPCALFPVDTSTKPNVAMGTNNRVYIPEKDQAWIGAAMDIDTKHQRVITCGHRWRNSIYRLEHYISGACYWSNLHNNSTKTLLPLVNKHYETRSSVFYYAQGQAGASVHFPETENAQLIMGAPGVYNWKGNSILYEDSSVKLLPNHAPTNVEFSKLIVPDASKTKETHSFGYFGYSISSGRFFSPNEILYVAGAPRSSVLKGQILVFEYPKNYEGELKIWQSRQGTLTGEYFGASIAVGDINGDNLDDIIVGAPHYSTTFDEGRVYIFYGSRRKTLLKPDKSPTIDGQAPGGQFGSAIQSLGDIDFDGYADVAISAPYEDNQHGVVYIYNGRKKDYPLVLSQRIEGKRIYLNLKGFGISFSRPTDIDNNNIADIAVGSYLSENAVVLRSRPVVTLEMSVTSVESRLESQARNFSIEICLSYRGKHLPSSLVVVRSLQLDENLRRVYLINHPESLSKIQHNITLFDSKKQCETITLGFKNMKNLIDPIEIIVQQELLEKPIVGKAIFITSETENNNSNNKFCKFCPVVKNSSSLKEIKIEVPFALNCGKDNKCDADLKISANFKGLTVANEFVIGTRSSLLLEIIVINSKEPAYLTQVEVEFPENINLEKIPSACKEETKSSTLFIVCDIDNPLEQNMTKYLTLNLDMSGVTNLKQRTLTFLIKATSKSEDINIADNTLSQNLTLAIDASVEIKGNSDKDIYYYGPQSMLVNSTHLYKIQKSGISPLNEFLMNISIPIAIKTKDTILQFVSIYKPSGVQGDQPFSCQWPDVTINEETKEQSSDLVIDDKDSKIKRNKRSTMSPSKNTTNIILITDKVAFINCSMSNIVCKYATCVIGPFKRSLKVASLQIKLVLNMTVLKKHVLSKDKDIIYVSTDGNVKEIDGLRHADIRVSNVFLSEPIPEKIESWIIIVSVIVGVLILLLIIMGLIKAGFFERKQKAELEAMKQAEVEQEFEIINDTETSTECLSD